MIELTKIERKALLGMLFTKAEQKALLAFLADYAERLDGAKCNDYELDNTPENADLVKSAIRSIMSKKDAEICMGEMDQFSDEFKILTTDTLILGYLIGKLK
jgi:hypothetical protein